jgi:sporulation protein YlmC with PRC-barrel domain
MLKTHIAACLMATALVAAPALAQVQTDQPPAATGDTMQPRPLQGAPADTQATPGAIQPDAATQSGAPQTDAAQDTTPRMDAPATDTAAQPMETTTTEVVVQDEPGADLRIEGGVIAMQSPNHVLANDLIGVNVIGADDASIGSVKDLVLDAEHRVVGVIVGVGGFLGIGAKDVGLPMNELNIVPDVDTTAAVGTGEATAREIEEIRVNMTREQLDEAPEFARLERPAPAVDTPATGPAGGGMGGGMGGGGMGGAPAQPN